jgi:hypothetical protein
MILLVRNNFFIFQVYLEEQLSSVNNNIILNHHLICSFELSPLHFIIDHRLRRSPSSSSSYIYDLILIVKNKTILFFKLLKLLLQFIGKQFHEP